MYFNLHDNINIRVLNKNKTILCFPNLSYIIKKKYFDVVFSPSPEASTVLFFSAKLVLYPGKIILRESNFRSYSSNKSIIRNVFTRFAYRNCNKVISLSKGVKNDLINRYKIKSDKISVIYNPIDINWVKKEIKKTNELSPQIRNKMKNDFHIIAVGRLVYQKGFDLLIKAMNRLKDKNIYLTIIGTGEDELKLNKMLNQYRLNDKIFINGFNGNPYVNLFYSDLFVLPSRWEGFGHVIIEAMACQTPVIAFNCDCGPSEIIDDKIDGILCNPESINELSDAILELYKSDYKRKELVKNSSIKVLKFDQTKISKNYLNVFLEK